MTGLGDRFWSKVGPAGIDDCWPWLASVNDAGYGQYTLPADDGRILRRAHRLAYEELVGEIPDGLVLDHLCRNRACVNPWHLEPVTHKVNINRGQSAELTRQRRVSRCKRGHEFTEANTYVRVDGERNCRTCAADRARAKRKVA